MQILLLLALALSLLVVVFALQNIVPVTVTVFVWTYQGSLALVLFVAFVAGALVSVLASLPSLVRTRWALSQLRRRLAEAEARAAPPA
ncbi:MAG: LapA family protein, partial [Acidobacteria bacterium]|nr:LapA family protein [Acidobacteriota bacterium]